MISKKSNGFKKHGNGNQANCGSNWIRPTKRKAIYLRDDRRCIYCLSDGPLTLDHLIPQELGGSNATSNLVTCCKSCNCIKGKKTIKRFFTYLRKNGADTDAIAKRIRKHTRRKLKGVKYRI